MRVPLPAMNLDAAHLEKVLSSGKPILTFEQVPIDWSDLRFLVRSTADAMRTHEAIEEDDYRRVEALTRDATRLAPAIRDWFEAARAIPAGGRDVGAEIAGLEPLLLQAMRPFLSRCADAIMARSLFQGWPHGNCPLCGGEPDFSYFTPAAERLLICSRCTSRWRFHQLACPFCLNDDRTRITSFATRDGRYRLNGCDVCQRYIKAFDGRNATRQVMPAVDAHRHAAAGRGGSPTRLSVTVSPSSSFVRSSVGSSFAPASVSKKKGPARSADPYEPEAEAGSW